METQIYMAVTASFLFVALIIVRVLPTVNEYSTILRAVQVIAKNSPSTVAEARAAGFPVYCTGVAPYSGPKAGPFEVNVPVCCPQPRRSA